MRLARPRRMRREAPLRAYAASVMKRTGVVVVLVVALAAAAGCGSGEGVSVASSSVPPEDIPACSKIFEEGKKIEDPEFRKSCVTDSGELISSWPVELTCQDDRQLRWNDLAWGYVGEPMTLTPEDDPSKMPTEAVDECLAGATTESAGSP
jgi:hypothetical protein